MRKINYLLCLIVLFISCNNSEKAETTKDEFTHPTIVLMHSPTGIRVEYNIDNQELELWISPQAGKDNDYWIRNFSNRDDHTNLFDKITFPELKLSDFESCTYDPFHSIVYFKDYTLHIAILWDDPAVIVWFEEDALVHFKSDKADKIVSREDKLFHVNHPDRGLDLSFVAAIAEGEGKFEHQLQVDRGRSIFARAFLSPNQPLFILGELEKENVPSIANKIVSQDPLKLIENTNEKVDEIVQYGRVIFKEDTVLQNLVDFNRRIWLSVQDHSGSLHASIKEIYYLIWVREGGLACPFIGYTGWMYPLEQWTDFQMENPTEIYDEGPGGRFFGQLVNGKITKWQEDGEFYAIWSAFTHWTQSGNNEFVSGENLKLLEESMDWLERYCYDKERKLFWRTYYCETPLKESRDYSWDNAVGKPVLGWDPAPYKGKDIRKTYDIYINMLSYSSYVMLASMNKGEKSEFYLQKAKDLEEGINKMFKDDPLPDYGQAITLEGEEITADPYGLDETDYHWALTCPTFYPDMIKTIKARKALLSDLLNEPDDYFLASYFSILGEADIEFCDQDSIMEAVQYAAESNYSEWKYIPLANSMVEMSGPPPHNAAHYIRPQMFTIGAWQGAMAGLGIERSPFGIAMRNAKHISAIEKYQYKNKLIDINWEGEGLISEIIVNGESISNTWQISEDLLNKKENTIVVKMQADAKQENVLVSSTVQVNSSEGGSIKIKAFGKNVLIIKNPGEIKVIDAEGNEIEITSNTYKNYSFVEFSGVGEYVVQL